MLFGSMKSIRRSLNRMLHPFFSWFSRYSSSAWPNWFQPALVSNKSTVSGGESGVHLWFIAKLHLFLLLGGGSIGSSYT